MSITWHWYAWRELSPDRLHDFLKLRSDIFVVEQNCVYADMDGRDPACEHLCAYAGPDLVAYLRLLPPGVKYPQPALGRLVVERAHRGRGLARDAIARGLARCDERYPGLAVFGQAQAHLAPFYQSLGFAPRGPQYLEDGIPHVDMLRAR